MYLILTVCLLDRPGLPATNCKDTRRQGGSETGAFSTGGTRAKIQPTHVSLTRGF